MLRTLFRLIAPVAATALAATAFAQSPATCNWKTYDAPGSPATTISGSNGSGTYVGSALNAKGNNAGFTLVAGTYKKFTVTNAAETEIESINRLGWLAGDYVDSSGRQHGFLRRSGKTQRVDYPGAGATMLFAATSGGVLAGTYYNGDRSHGFVKHNSSYVRVDYPNARSTSIRAMNDKNIIVGTYENSYGLNRGFVIRDGKSKSLRVPGSDETSALGVSPAGTVVGNYFDASGGHGFIYRSGTYKTIDYPGRAMSTVPFSMDKNGTIVGSYVDATGAQHGFIAKNCN
jgi:hypothetical protein